MFATSEQEHQQPATLRELVDMAAGQYGSKPFFKFIRENELYEKDYLTVREDSFSVCRYIRSVSDKKMHIAIVGGTNYEYIICVTGVIISGNTVVPIAPDAPTEDIVSMLRAADVDMLFYDAAFSSRAEQLLPLCPFLRHSVNLGNPEMMEALFAAYNSTSDFASLSDFSTDPEACCVIMFTSGTTGVRKGVMLSEKALLSNMNFREFSFTSEDVTLSVLPMYHIFAFSCDFLKNFKDGVTVCLNENIVNLVRNFQLYQPTMIRMVPVMIETILKKIHVEEKKNPTLTPREVAEKVVGKRLTWIIASGAYLNPQLVFSFEKYGITLRAAYGMTEAGPRISVPDGETSPDSVGRIISIAQARIRDGEIQVYSDSLMLGYYKMPEETAEMFTEDGWLRTGDMGRIGEDRQLYITGRLKNLIILSNGVNVSPEELEKKCLLSPMIREVMVCEEADRIIADFYPDMEYMQSAGIADTDAAIRELTESINASVPTEQQISRIRIRTEPLPKTKTGKIIRKTIQYANV